MATRFPALSGETDFFLQFTDPKPAKLTPMASKPVGGLDHLDNLCRLMDQLSQLREQNTRLQSRVQYLETLQESLSKTSPSLEEEIGKPGSAWGRVKTILTHSKKESHGTEGEASKWRRMKRVLMTKKSQSAILQRSHSVPSSPTTGDAHSGDSKDEVLIRTNAGEFRFQGVSDTFRRRLMEWEKKKGVAPDSSCLAFLEEESENKPNAKLERNRSYSDSSLTGEVSTQEVAPRSTSEPQLPPKPEGVTTLEDLHTQELSCRELQKQVDKQLRELQEQVKQLEEMVTQRNDLLNQLLKSQSVSVTQDSGSSSPKLDFASAFSTAIYDDEALQVPSPEQTSYVSVTVKLPSRDVTTSVTFPPPKIVPPSPRLETHHPSVPLPSRLEPALKVKSMVERFNNQGSPQLQRPPPPPEGILKSSSFCTNQSCPQKFDVVKSISSTSVFQSEPKCLKVNCRSSITDITKTQMSNPLPMSPRTVAKRGRNNNNNNNNNNSCQITSEIHSPPPSPRSRPVPSPRVTRLKLRHARDEFLYRPAFAQERLTIHEEQIRQTESLSPTLSSIKRFETQLRRAKTPPVTSQTQSLQETATTTQKSSSNFLSFNFRRPKKQQQNSQKVCRQSLFVSVPTDDSEHSEETNRQSCPASPEKQSRRQLKAKSTTSWFTSTCKLFKS